jgi:hypothetical protein
LTIEHFTPSHETAMEEAIPLPQKLDRQYQLAAILLRG